MDSEEFRKRGKEMVDYIADYLDSISERRVTPNIEPGYLRKMLPKKAPQEPENWDDIMKDIEDKIMPGMTHWQHPQFHAYFPSGNSYPSILGDMLSDGLGCIGFSWAASPACTELEIIVLDWMAKMVGLPKSFLAYDEESKGGGVLQGSASECVFVTLLAARAHKIRELKKQHPFVEEGVLMSKLMAYCSREAHSCVEKCAMMAFVKLRILQPDEKQSLRGPTLQQALEEDIAMGLIPFYCEITLGTTSCCSFDNLKEIGPICENYGIWLHVDGAYAGNSFICPELREPMQGIEYASSFNFNPNKFMLTNFDCSVMWVKDRIRFTQALVVDPLYLQHSYSDKCIDYRHWGIPLSRRFRALKLWFVIRSFGVEGLQKYIREHCRLAKIFESLVRRDARFEVASPVHLGLVCFRLKASNQMNAKLLSSINAAGKLHMVPASLGEKYVIRFCVCAQNASERDIEYAWETISEYAYDIQEIMDQESKKKRVIRKPEPIGEMPKVPEEEEGYGSSEEVFQLDRKTRRSLRYKRSFFVRMVSDPKLYNPSVVRSLPPSQQARHSSLSEERNNDASSQGAMDQASVSRSSWISWPLAFLLHGVFEDSSEEPALPVRFRNWNTKLTLRSTSPQRNENSRRSPSPGSVLSDPSSGKTSQGSSPQALDIPVVTSRRNSEEDQDGSKKNGLLDKLISKDHGNKGKSSKSRHSPQLRRSSQVNEKDAEKTSK